MQFSWSRFSHSLDNVAALFRKAHNGRNILDDTSQIYNKLLRDTCIVSAQSQNVFIIQPNAKHAAVRRRFISGVHMERDKQPTVGPSIAEARALVDSLGSWRTIGARRQLICDFIHLHPFPKASFSLRGSIRFNRERFFTKGVWEEVTKTVELYRTGRQNLEQSDDAAEMENPRATAVLINWSRLSTLQISTMQRAWSLPVFDRYSLVVQLFNLRARSQEAKLQAQLAELGLLRARLPALFSLTPSDTKSTSAITGTPLLHMDQLLKERETRLLDQLTAVEQRRQATRQHRREKQTHQFPIVTVVGYTNAGKTSLIRCLSGNQKISSSPQVFATLDVTHHRARLPAFHKHYLGAPSDTKLPAGSEHFSKFGLPGIHLLLLDTIGFMADLPTNLIAAFRATLEECLDTDLILHVIDISEPDWERRASHVDSVLTRAGVRVRLNTTTLFPQSHFKSDEADKRDSPTILRVFFDGLNLVSDVEVGINTFLPCNVLLQTKLMVV
ncbi:uncharacterized protein DEA37_0007077 [Paragonimus westermani]|uniref:Hflx-type G domain-containing protein n=1 Tax=Paragonimus westermani TaxID=34504 RepID=A0A5J4NBX2_9TREM|nr:uncharacterized protein DEA37_0007077 [Paragonimus westermani]